MAGHVYGHKTTDGANKERRQLEYEWPTNGIRLEYEGNTNVGEMSDHMVNTIVNKIDTNFIYNSYRNRNKTWREFFKTYTGRHS